ncbi:IPT/TIG domain-containing protein [Saccharicrinis sp. GN24d3]|uniref:IPT/TIG domain-containing protein n=1 Tax=Saccharicrinis sp. GN24d3 TaxID=3458416 RepID=UPI00403717DF
MKNKLFINSSLAIMLVCVAFTVAVVGCSDDDEKVTPPATITSLSITEGAAGTAVTIVGANFSAVTAENKVFFGDIEAVVTGGTTTSLITKVPLGASSGPVSVQVGMAAKVVGPVFTIKENLLTIHLKHVNDDAEEAEVEYNSTPAGFMELTSSDLELCDIDSDFGYQYIGTRFRTVNIPKGAVVTKAYIQFTADDTGSDPCKMRIYGEAKDTGEFTDTPFSISSRTKTSANALWDIPAWTAIDERDEAQQTADLTEVVQEIIDHADWTEGGNMTFILSIEEGKGGDGREAETWSSEGDEAGDDVNAGEESASLIIEYK